MDVTIVGVSSDTPVINYTPDAIDEYMLQQMKEFDGKKMISITKEGLDLGEDTKELQKEYQGVCDKVKEILDKKISNYCSLRLRASTNASSAIALKDLTSPINFLNDS